MKHCVYLLRFKDHPDVFKVGMANSLHHRISTLEKTWGDCDLSESYHVALPVPVTGKFKKAIHLYMNDEASTMPYGDGYTEFFNLAGLEDCLQMMELFAAKHGAKLVKGHKPKSKAVRKPKPKEDPRDLEAEYELLLVMFQGFMDSIPEAEVIYKENQQTELVIPCDSEYASWVGNSVFRNAGLRFANGGGVNIMTSWRYDGEFMVVSLNTKDSYEEVTWVMQPIQGMIDKLRGMNQ